MSYSFGIYYSLPVSTASVSSWSHALSWSLNRIHRKIYIFIIYIFNLEYCIHIHIVFVAEIISPHNVFKEEAIRSLCCKFQFKSNVFALTSLLYELMTTRNEMTKIIIRTIDQIPFFFKGKIYNQTLISSCTCQSRAI